jgi:hypothetical protein
VPLAELFSGRTAQDPHRLVELGRPEGPADELAQPACRSAHRQRASRQRRGQLCEHGLGLGPKAALLVLRRRIAVGDPRAQPERAEVDRPKPGRAAARSPDGDLGRPATDVAHGDGPVADDVLECALEGEAGLLLLGQDPRRRPGRSRDQADELVGIAGLPAGGGDHDVDQRRARRAGIVDEVAHALRRLGELRRGDGAELLDVAAEADDALAARNGRERSAHLCPDQQADGVGTDVDNRDVHASDLGRGPGCEAETLW